MSLQAIRVAERSQARVTDASTGNMGNTGRQGSGQRVRGGGSRAMGGGTTIENIRNKHHIPSDSPQNCREAMPNNMKVITTTFPAVFSKCMGLFVGWWFLRLCRGLIFRGPICRGPIFRGPICRGPICRRHGKLGPFIPSYRVFFFTGPPPKSSK